MKNSNQILSFNSLITDYGVPDPLGWSLIFESNKMNFINEGSHQTAGQKSIRKVYIELSEYPIYLKFNRSLE